MRKRHSYNFIVILLIFSFITTPYLGIISRAEAQSYVAGHTSGIATAINSLPQCQDVDIGTKMLFVGVAGTLGSTLGGEDIGSSLLVGGISAGTTYLVDSLKSTISSTVEEAEQRAKSKPSYDSPANKKLDKIQAQNEKILKIQTAMKDNATCTAAIGRIITKTLLQKITVSTITWIKSGFDGSPAFVQDPGQFFGDIAKNEVLQLGIEISNPELFPFGKAWMKNTAAAFNNKFQDNARYTLKEVEKNNPNFTPETFYQDFSQGGWNAWTAMTQSPANNPLGFQLMASNELQKRLAGTTQSTAEAVHEAMSQANGFLGDMRCTDPEGVTREEDDAAKRERSLHPNGDTDPKTGIPKYLYTKRLCNKWEYVTPGKMISDAATSTMNTTKDSLLAAEDLNDAIAAVTDALIAHFSSDLMEKGFLNTQSDNFIGSTDFSPSNYQTQTEKDFATYQLATSSWLKANPNFNIRTDLTQALIDEQRTYSDKLKLQNKELNSTIDGQPYNLKSCPLGWTGEYPNCIGSEQLKILKKNGLFFKLEDNPKAICPSGWTGTYPNCTAPGGLFKGVTNAYGLMPAIYQLDYCIPGPHPGWENDSRETLSAQLNNITPGEQRPVEMESSIVNGAIGVGLSSVPYVGPILSGLFGALTGENEAKNRDRDARCDNTRSFYRLTGFSFQCPWKIASETPDVNMLSKEGLFFVLNTVLDRYIKIMGKTYFSDPEMMPDIKKEAAKEFNLLSGYNQIIKSNEDKILSMKTTVKTLEDIKDTIDKLNDEYPDGGEEYETALKAQINAFGRISAEMVNGDDIAQADDLSKQIVQKKNYIYKNLLKGPYGCESYLENNTPKKFLSAGSGVKQPSTDWSNYDINTVKRMTYPFPILYDYNNFAANDNLPDPWNSDYKTKMPTQNSYDKFGPGFLSFVYFGTTYGSGNDNNYDGSERLSLGGLIYNYDSGGEGGQHVYDWVSLGKSKTSTNDNSTIPFETTIGIY